MPRIVPLQLLRCLKVLLDDNGGILSISEVKRIAGLMTKYSKKLVSKCIYVQILKVTKTELLGEFMAVGGWSLVYNWLNDAIRAMNWPLVQEILELLLLCPVDVDRLKINSAPKLVKGLCKDGGNEGVRILAKRLVEQWLKVVTENTATTPNETSVQPAGTMTPQTILQTATTPTTEETKPVVTVGTAKPRVDGMLKANPGVEEDPLADVGDVTPEPTSYTLTPAQKKASEAGLVYKIIYKDGQQMLAKVPKGNDVASAAATGTTVNDEDEDEDEEPGKVAEEESESVELDEQDEADVVEHDAESAAAALVDEDDTRTSGDKLQKESESSEDEETRSILKAAAEETLNEERQTGGGVEEKNDKKEKVSKDSKDDKEKSDKDRKSEKDGDKEKIKEHKSSSSRHSSSSSSSHKSKSSSSSSSSKSKSSSSSHRSSSDKDKHRSDKEKSNSSSSRDKDRSSSSKHKSSLSSKSSSSSSSSSSSKDRHRDKSDKDRLSSSSSSSSVKKDKERDKEAQAEKDKDTLAKMIPPSLDKLGKIPKKPKDENEVETVKATSITIPSKKASMSIEIRRDSEKAKTVKTYKSQFRSHGLTEEAPPPPSRKGLKKPNSLASAPGTVIPTSLPSSLKRPSPPPSDSPTQKKPKIDLNNVTVANEKPGAIKLIAPKKIQTLVETNLFSDALSAATGPKKTVKRKRASTPAPGQAKEGPSPPTSPDAPKVAPLKFYQDTLDESKIEDRSDKEQNSKESKGSDDAVTDKENSTEDDDDIPLKKVKEDIEQKVLREKAAEDGAEIGSDGEDSATREQEEPEVKKPGPGCGPNGPPGVLMLHRRKGPKKKLTWRPQEHLEQIRYFELDETERVNVTKTTSFMDMKNLERFNERDAINIARRGMQFEDNMKPQTAWRALIEVDDVPPHPNGSQSRQRKVQAERETTTLRALYFSHAMIPDSPAEAELEPHFAHDVPVIPLDDITGNPDAVNDFTTMPWPEPKGSPKYGENNTMAGAESLASMTGASIEGYGAVNPMASAPTLNAFPPFMGPFGNQVNALPLQHQQPMPVLAANAQPAWANTMQNGPTPLLGNQFMKGPLVGSPNMEMNGSPQNFMGPFGHNAPFMANGPQFAQPFGGPPNFNQINPMVMARTHAPGQRMNMRNNNNNMGGGNWRTGPNFQDGGGGGGGGNAGNWTGGRGGPNRGGNNPNSGICKAFMRGHCRLGKSCKFTHPKSKRI